MGTRMHADKLTHSDTELPSLLSIVSRFSCLLLWTWDAAGPARHRVSALYLIMANPTGLGRVETQLDGRPCQEVMTADPDSSVRWN